MIRLKGGEAPPPWFGIFYIPTQSSNYFSNKGEIRVSSTCHFCARVTFMDSSITTRRSDFDAVANFALIVGIFVPLEFSKRRK